MKDESWISEDTGIGTFIKVIEEIDIEDVKGLDIYTAKIPLIADKEYSDKAQRKSGNYYIYSGLANAEKKKILEDISDRLDLGIEVFINQTKKNRK